MRNVLYIKSSVTAFIYIKKIYIYIYIVQVESGGTVLSTNWSEVGQGKVEKKPPDGMEWKTWNS